MNSTQSTVGFTCTAIPIAAMIFLFYRSASRVRRMKRRRRELRAELMREAKLCAKCGYDVRGSGKQCSECGWPTAEDDH